MKNTEVEYEMNISTGYCEVNGARLFYQLAGAGQPMVFIHAGVADSRQWDNEFTEFSRDFHVLRYDLRGYGKSLPVEGEFSHLADLTALLDRLNLDQPLIMIGCSMGGSLTLDFTLANPNRVKAIIMVGSGPSGLSLEVPDHPKAEEAEQAYNAGDLDRLAELEAQIWFDGMGRGPDQVNPVMRKLAVEMNRLALAHDAKKLGKQLPDVEINAVEQLHRLAVPLLAIVGEHDLPYLQAAADYMANKIPGARKVILADAAHLANIDQPVEFQRAVREFLKDYS